MGHVEEIPGPGLEGKVVQNDGGRVDCTVPFVGCAVVAATGGSRFAAAVGQAEAESVIGKIHVDTVPSLAQKGK